MPPTILAIETATESCSVALLGPGIQVERRLETGRRHAESLLILIDTLLVEAGVPRAKLSGIAVSAGPGSYTGLRIGVSAAKGISEALDVPVMAVSSLKAAALAGGCPDGLIAAAFPSRKGQVYAAAFTMEGSEFTAEGSALAGPADQVLASLIPEGQTGHVIGPGADRFSPVPGVKMRQTETSAWAVALLGLGLFKRGVLVDRQSFEPYYLNDVVASIPTGTAFSRLSP